MLIEPYDIDIQQDEEGVFIAKSHLLPGCHSSGATKNEALFSFQEAAAEHLNALKDFGKPIPEPFRGQFVLLYR